MEALARYDRSLVVGILGGSAGTTFDAFHMLWEAKKYGARVALYGRKINNAEHQLSFIQYLRAVADDESGRRKPSRPTTAPESSASSRGAGWPTTSNGPRPRRATAARSGRKAAPARPETKPMPQERRISAR